MIEYLRWQYGEGLSEILQAWKNVHWFLYNFFSIPILVRSFFAPFHRIQERRKRGFDPEDIIQVFIINMVTRLVGVFVRTVFIVVGLAAQLVLGVIGITFIISSLVAPALIPASIIFGIFLAAF